jgi:hypothetical protein
MPSWKVIEALVVLLVIVVGAISRDQIKRQDGEHDTDNASDR